MGGKEESTDAKLAVRYFLFFIAADGDGQVEDVFLLFAVTVRTDIFGAANETACVSTAVSCSKKPCYTAAAVQGRGGLLPAFLVPVHWLVRRLVLLLTVNSAVVSRRSIIIRTKSA